MNDCRFGVLPVNYPDPDPDDLVSRFNVGLKSHLKQGLSEPRFYGDLVYQFRKIVGRNDFSDQFRNIIIHYKRTSDNIAVMVRPAGVQLLDFCCSSVSVLVLLLRTHLVSSQLNLDLYVCCFDVCMS